MSMVDCGQCKGTGTVYPDGSAIGVRCGMCQGHGCITVRSPVRSPVPAPSASSPSVPAIHRWENIGDLRRAAVPGGWLYAGFAGQELVFVPTPAPARVTASASYTPVPWKLNGMPGWSECGGVLLREDGVRLSLDVDPSAEGMERDEEGDPLAYTLRWLVQLPIGTSEPGRVNYTTGAIAMMDPLSAIHSVDLRWPPRQERT